MLHPRLRKALSNTTLFLLWSFLCPVLGSEPTVQAVRIEAEGPKIDGKLNDECWEKAALISGLTQQFPNEQTTPSEKTEIRICYDAENFYVSFTCTDSNPSEINASIMQRDQSVGPDDYVFVLLDPFQTGREGYYFRLNANGAIGDGRITEQSKSPNMNWDTLWEGAAKITETGWTAELAIPFRSISFDPDSTTWAANFGRMLPRSQERDRWAGALRQRSTHKLDNAGFITGLSNLERGIGVDLKPYALGTRFSEAGSSRIESEYGGDVFWQVTPSITSTLTLNTDFAETEVDDRVVNLTRFPLFFPEKRDFFLEGEEFFQFGPYSNSLRAFHSRTIGISNDGDKVAIPMGVKVSGRSGKWGVGVLGTQLDSTGTLQDDKVGVARFTYDLSEQSRVGSFLSYGDPRGNGDNTVAGIDYSYKNSHWKGSNDLIEIDLFEMMSEDSGVEGHAFGAQVRFPNEPFGYRLGFRQIDESFRPAAGFVRRAGTTRYQVGADYEWYPQSDLFEEFGLGTDLELTTTTSAEIESVQIDPVTFRARFHSGDDFFIRPGINREVLFEDFEIADGVILNPGDYRFNHLKVGFDTSSKRDLSTEMSFTLGEFWDGNRWRLSNENEWRTSKHLGFFSDLNFNQVSLPSGDFEVLVGAVGFRVTPNPKLSFNTLAQWDTVSKNVGLNGRIRWIVKPGCDIFVVFNKGLEYRDDRSFKSLRSDMTTKIGWTFRY